MADIPGIEWETPPGVNRARLRGADDVPEVGHHGFWWPLYENGRRVRGGSTGSSPSLQHMEYDEGRTRSREEWLQLLYECLDLPGRAADYHHLIETTVDGLYKIRAREPESLRDVHRLAHLDVAFIRTRPEVLERGGGDLDLQVYLSGLETLVQLHLRSGELKEAEEIASVGVDEFGAGHLGRPLEAVRTRLLALEAEDA